MIISRFYRKVTRVNEWSDTRLKVLSTFVIGNNSFDDGNRSPDLLGWGVTE